MAVGLPLKTTYANGDVYSASDVNDTNGTINLIKPTAKGDLFVGSAANTYTKLAVGSNDQVLMADSTTATGTKWANAVTGMTLISTTSLSGSSTAISSIPSTYKNLQLVIKSAESNSTANVLSFTVNSITNYNYIGQWGNNLTGVAANSTGFSTSPVKLTATNLRNSNSSSCFVIDFFDYANTTTSKEGRFTGSYLIGTNYGEFNNGGFSVNDTAAISSITIAIAGGSTFSAGTALLYGVK
jgi:hypothetical protein